MTGTSGTSDHTGSFFRACATGDVPAVRDLLAADGALVRARTGQGQTGLHLAHRHPDVVALLLEHGADPNAREQGDNVTPLHLAAANRSLDSVRLLVDAGADVHGEGDLHEGGVIGWAAAKGNEAVVDLLLARGARHHIFSAMALGDRDLVRRLVEEDRACLARRRSRFENRQTPVHAAFARPDGIGWLAGAADYEMLKLLIDLGADVEAADDRARTPMTVAMLCGDREAMRLLAAAGAAVPPRPEAPRPDALAAAARTVAKGSPMFNVPDMRPTVAWYEAAGFTVIDRYEDGGELGFALLSFGNAQFALGPGDAPSNVSLWFTTDRIDELYALFKARQMRWARAALDGETPAEPALKFEEDLYAPFYGGRQFSIEDPNGLSLVFYEPQPAVTE